MARPRRVPDAPTKHLNFRVTDEEYQEIREAADTHTGGSVSALLRAAPTLWDRFARLIAIVDGRGQDK